MKQQINIIHIKIINIQKNFNKIVRHIFSELKIFIIHTTLPIIKDR